MVSRCHRSRHEVLVNGRKQGATKKAVEGKATGSSALCKKSLFDACRHLLAGDGGREVTYAQAKLDATSYRRRCAAIRRRLGCWTVKPEGLLDFTWRPTIVFWHPQIWSNQSAIAQFRTSGKTVRLTAILLYYYIHCIRYQFILQLQASSSKYLNIG